MIHCCCCPEAVGCVQPCLQHASHSARYHALQTRRHVSRNMLYLCSCSTHLQVGFPIKIWPSGAYATSINSTATVLCTVANAGVLTASAVSQVIISTNINSPARMQPFLLAYTSAPNRQVQNVLWASLLVVRVPFTPSKNTWAAVINRAGPAECFFNSNGDQDLMTACPA